MFFNLFEPFFSDPLNLFGSDTLMGSELPITEADVVTLPMKRRHAYGDAKCIAMPAALDRTSQTERTCEACGVVKITVHAAEGGGWREWRWPGNRLQFEATETPECKGVQG